MEEGILDEIDENDRGSETYWSKRSFKLLIYALCILALIIGRFLLPYFQNKDFLPAFWVTPVFLLGLAGIWMFSGLGSYAAFQAIRKAEPADWRLIAASVGNGLFFVLSSWRLLAYWVV